MHVMKHNFLNSEANGKLAYLKEKVYLIFCKKRDFWQDYSLFYRRRLGQSFPKVLLRRSGWKNKRITR